VVILCAIQSFDVRSMNTMIGWTTGFLSGVIVLLWLKIWQWKIAGLLHQDIGPDLIARASPAAHSGQLSAVSSDCVSAGREDYDRFACLPAQNKRMAKSWRNA
jgi:hypothetical protein